jgi:hypothetical protein
MNNKVTICGTEFSLLDVEEFLNELSINLSNSQCMLRDLTNDYFGIHVTKLKAEPSILLMEYEEYSTKAHIAADYIRESQAKIEEAISLLNKEFDDIRRQKAAS